MSETKKKKPTVGVTPENKVLTAGEGNGQTGRSNTEPIEKPIEKVEVLNDVEQVEKLQDLSNHEATPNALENMFKELQSSENVEGLEDTEFDDLEDYVEEIGDGTPTEPAPTQDAAPTEEGGDTKLDAESVIVISDVILSRSFNFLAQKFLKKNPTPTSFALTTKEKKVLEQPVQRVLDTMNFDKLTPMQGLAMVLLPIYGAKFMSLESAQVDQETGEPVKKAGRGRRAHKKDENGKVIIPKRYEDNNELVNP